MMRPLVILKRTSCVIGQPRRRAGRHRSCRYLPPCGGGRPMQACLHGSGEGVSSHKSLFCLRRSKSIALKLKTEQVKFLRRDPLSRSQRNCAAIDLPHEGGGEDCRRMIGNGPPITPEIVAEHGLKPEE